MRKYKLDRIDRQILNDLQNDGRMSNVDLAKRVGISAPPCLRRVKALENAEIIRGYYADIDPAVVDYHLVVYANVGLEKHADEDLRAFTALVESWPMVREAYMMAGDTDYMLKVVARDWDHYQEFFSNVLTTAPNVTHVKSNMTIRNVKTKPGVPITLDGVDEDMGGE
ncbi:MAG: AsnC family transcriptional regulator [Alphaproteobacteria bacterium]|nr:AsnC family transcriptional regulator [Alphaproteobacteria bacterium]